MVLDPAATAIAVCLLFGGDQDLPVPPLNRDLSAIEAQVADILFREVAAAVAACGPATLAVRAPPPAVTGLELTKQILRDGPAVAVSINVSLPAATGSLRLCIPQRLLLKKNAGASAPDKANGAAWGARFGEEVMRSAVTLQATMPLKRMTLADLAELRVGEVIELSETAQTEAKLGARGQTLFVCEFGKLGQNYTVRVRHPFDAGQDFIEGLLPA
jgi:flagellar motor switch protein FliM